MLTIDGSITGSEITAEGLERRPSGESICPVCMRTGAQIQHAHECQAGEETHSQSQLQMWRWGLPRIRCCPHQLIQHTVGSSVRHCLDIQGAR